MKAKHTAFQHVDHVKWFTYAAYSNVMLSTSEPPQTHGILVQLLKLGRYRTSCFIKSQTISISTSILQLEIALYW